MHSVVSINLIYGQPALPHTTRGRLPSIFERYFFSRLLRGNGRECIHHTFEFAQNFNSRRSNTFFSFKNQAKINKRNHVLLTYLIHNILDDVSKSKFCREVEHILFPIHLANNIQYPFHSLPPFSPASQSYFPLHQVPHPPPSSLFSRLEM